MIFDRFRTLLKYYYLGQIVGKHSQCRLPPWTVWLQRIIKERMTKTTKYQLYQEYDIIASKPRKSVEENAFQSESKNDVASWMTRSDRKMKLKSVNHFEKENDSSTTKPNKKNSFWYVSKVNDYRYPYPFDNEREAPESVRELLDFEAILSSTSYSISSYSTRAYWGRRGGICRGLSLIARDRVRLWEWGRKVQSWVSQEKLTEICSLRRVLSDFIVFWGAFLWISRIWK